MYRVDLTLPEAEFSAAMTAMRKGLDGHIRWDLDGTSRGPPCHSARQ
jgi:hypothetical protein